MLARIAVDLGALGVRRATSTRRRRGGARSHARTLRPEGTRARDAVAALRRITPRRTCTEILERVSSCQRIAACIGGVGLVAHSVCLDQSGRN